MACALTPAPRARAADAPQLLAYPLRHAQAAEVQSVLAQLLGPLAAQSQLTVDARANQLLVAGPAAAHELTKQLIETLDQPQRGSVEAGLVLRAYPLGGGRLEEAAARLSEQLRQLEPRTRVTADPRNGQILVWAPAAIHDEAATRLRLFETAPALPTVGPRPAPQLPEVRAIPLAHLRVDQLEPVLREMFGQRLRPLPDGAGSTAAYQLSCGAAGNLRLVFEARTGQVILQGPPKLVSQFQQVVAALDHPRGGEGEVIRVLPLGQADLSKVRQAVEAYRGAAPAGAPPAGAGAQRGPSDQVRPAAFAGPIERRGPAVRRLPLHVAQQTEVDAGPTVESAPASGPEGLLPGTDDELRQRLRELGTDVEVEALPELDVIILRGNQRDVDEVVRIVEEIERLSAEAEPTIEVIALAHVGSEKLATLVRGVQLDLIGTRQGICTITALVKPNAVLLIGWGEALGAMRELVQKLDQPADAQSELRVFRLKYASAEATAKTVTEFFARRTGLGAKVLVVADPRTNSLLVQADPSDLAEVELLLARLDTSRGAAANELRVFKLKNTLAADLGPVLQAAISGTGPAAAGQGGAAATARSAVLKFLTIDAQGQKVLESGILGDIRITPDPRTNSLLISAPAETIELLAALVEQLDAIPAAVAQIKVFTIINGDAASLVEMLRNLLENRTAGLGPQLAGAEGEDSLAPLRFSVDLRTNSIIATGAAGELNIVEAILLRLDQSDAQERQTAVYRLKNAPATNVADSISQFVEGQRRLQQTQAQAGLTNTFRRVESEIVVVSEVVSNSLIISATPRYFDQIMRMVEQLDAEPAQVLIQLLIAEIQLNKTDEFGVELGLQDSLLFDRGILGGTIQSTIDGAGNIINQTTQPTVNAPGYNFNNQALGNSASPRAYQNSDKVGGQGLSSFSLGRTNSDLNFGGLVLSASSESVSVLLRALKERRRLDVLSRPQVMTLDNQPAYVQVGQRVPRVINTQLSQFGSVNAIDLYNIGLILLVTPRISPDGLVVMEIDTERSSIDNSQPPVVIGISQNGTPLTQPIFRTTTARTTVSAADGQTLILGGLLTNETFKQTRRVPVLSNIPVLGGIFRYDLTRNSRSELLIILTPHVVRSEADADRLKQIEANRISWCLADVQRLHGECGICQRGDCEHMMVPTEVIYPDIDPRGEGIEFEEIPDDGPSGPMLGQPEGDDEGPATESLPEPSAGAGALPSPVPPAPRSARLERRAPEPPSGTTTDPAGAPKRARPGPAAPVLRPVPTAGTSPPPGTAPHSGLGIPPETVPAAGPLPAGQASPVAAVGYQAAPPGPPR